MAAAILLSRRLLSNNAFQRPFYVLGLETSCDDTAAAVVSSEKEILSQIVIDQYSTHEKFRGIHPSEAAIAHSHNLPLAIQRALVGSGLQLDNIGAIAVTRGPGLGPCLNVGLNMAKALAASAFKPLLGIHHMAAHALTARVTNENIEFPYLCLLASGGHTLTLVVQSSNDFIQLGTTLDESVGNALDKVSTQLNLAWSLGDGGPGAALEAAAEKGDPNKLVLPQPLRHEPGFNFSFSGLRASFERSTAANPPSCQQDVFDLAASFHAAAFNHVLQRLSRAINHVQKDIKNINTLVVSGGVARNKFFRQKLDELCQAKGLTCVCPPKSLCSDNAVMIAWTGIERLLVNPHDHDTLDMQYIPKWPLDHRLRVVEHK